jgi:hypothetical protein
MRIKIKIFPWQNHELNVFRGLSVFFHICLNFFHQMLNINRSQQYVLFCCVEFWICFSLDINYVFRITLLWTSVWIWSCLSFSRHEDLKQIQNSTQQNKTYCWLLLIFNIWWKKSKQIWKNTESPRKTFNSWFCHCTGILVAEKCIIWIFLAENKKKRKYYCH